MRLFDEFRSHLQYKIIIPFLLLTLLVALAGAGVAFLLITGTVQERLDNQLVQVARATSDGVVSQERANLAFLREMAFAGPNPQAGAPAIADALAGGDPVGLAQALDPFFRISAQRPGVRVDRLIAFDTTRHSVVDWERAQGQSSGDSWVRRESRDLSSLWFVPRVLGRQQDALGDKYAGLLDLGHGTRYLFTVAPVLSGERVVGGLLVATRVSNLLQTLQDDSRAAIISLYDAGDGATFASTVTPEGGLAQLAIRPQLLPRVRELQTAQEQSIFDSVTINQRGYQFAYVPLRVRGNMIGILSVAQANDYVTSPWLAARTPLMLLTAGLVLAIIGLGVAIARQITRPLQELVGAAQAVTSGDLARRSQVTVRDEIGILSSSFNDMTAHLLDLYGAVRAESSQRAAIVESITDGVVVCDRTGAVLLINQATRALLRLSPDAEPPSRFDAIPLLPLSEAALSFGAERASNLFTLHDRIVRLSDAPVADDTGAQIGRVYVLQDLTSEVAIDRAKTNFMSTISHELRTPLTVMNGSSDLLLRELTGPLTDDQRILVGSIHKHSVTMTTLLNNVITLASLDSGTLAIELEPVDLNHILNDLLWSHRKPIAAKGLRLILDVPDDLPELIADPQQLRIVLNQLIDNARRYTAAGTLTIRATHAGDLVKIAIADTGCGIDPALAEHLFTRFTRGSEGINSAERGIGLGLAIAKELIERQGGAIWLDETSDHGSTFVITLPSANANQHYNQANLASAA
ncbi:MAG TPA: ATP-binding protein [Roseiflexaceae bacterium]|nr:ATP-binding protein [Roseiflexaceae bacterium]